MCDLLSLRQKKKNLQLSVRIYFFVSEEMETREIEQNELEKLVSVLNQH